MQILIILALSGLMHAARSFLLGTAASSAGVALSFGYLLLTAFFTGELFKRVGLPKLSGYLATGIVVGPEVLGLVSSWAVSNLGIVTGAAIALIALTAGTELELRKMRPLMRSIAWLTLVAVGGTTLLLSGVVYAARSWLTFMTGLTTPQALAVSAVLGVVMVAQSPAVVVALRDEVDADGPLARTVLGVVVIADLVVILMFTLVSVVAKSIFGGRADVSTTSAAVAWEIFGSLGAGLLIGGVLALFLRKVRASASLFVLTVCFVVAEVGRRIHLDPLLVALSAGMLVRNATRHGDELHASIEAAALPVYVVFFAVAGAAIRLRVFGVVGGAALLFVLTRALGLLAGGYLGARLAGAPEVVRRYVGFGLLPQAGLALALSLLFARSFPEFGADAGALTLAVVALNEILAPALYRTALIRSGEGTRDPVALPSQPPPHGPPSPEHVDST
ncbi:MAG: cation:proton antiporter [Polyangiales bacterium]